MDHQDCACCIGQQWAICRPEPKCGICPLTCMICACVLPFRLSCNFLGPDQHCVGAEYSRGSGRGPQSPGYFVFIISHLPLEGLEAVYSKSHRQ